MGFQVTSFVDASTGVVKVAFLTKPQHIGFQGVLHGGVLATVLDEAMVWAATWAQKRFCLAGEITVRFRSIAQIDRTLTVTAKPALVRSRLITTTGEIHDADRLIAEATGKYVPLSAEVHIRMCRTLVADPASDRAAEMLSANLPE